MGNSGSSEGKFPCVFGWRRQFFRVRRLFARHMKEKRPGRSTEPPGERKARTSRQALSNGGDKGARSRRRKRFERVSEPF
ncbi:hypothetical protein LFML04_1763 [Leptospirillum ferriphilum ML-04]|uniref:Uncharacterized protein n=1 Tax=Leptospirillum ferriphilum (strain ML-04) TaxID=1048260 RepID=J9ZDM6_LEPFM|nr:hypothetical protein LFML04_1763 [Leptospirillum ferriphilum ML-04]